MTSTPTPVVDAASAAPRHLYALLAANQLLTGDPCPATLPNRIVAAARRLLHAPYAGFVRYAAGPTDRIDRTGTGPADADALRLPARAVRQRVHEGPGSPPLRPVATPQLWVLPIWAGGELYGELYVGAPNPTLDPVEGRVLFEAFAACTGAAVETARAHDDAHRSRDWLRATSEIARALLAEAGPDTLLRVVWQGLHVADADCGVLILPAPTGALHVTVAAGLGADDLRDRPVDLERSALGAAIAAGRSLLVDDLSSVVQAGYDNVHGFGPIMTVPLVDARGVRGAVVLLRTRDRPPFEPGDLDLATAFADQVTLALEVDDARSSGEWLTALEDRDRIATDLNDNVMQRLFATGVGLQSLAADALNPDAAGRLAGYIADLDETIDEIRERVFGLLDGGRAPVGRASSRYPRVVRPGRG